MLGVALLAIASVASAANFTVPSTISAGVETQVTIGFDSWKQPFVYETAPDSVWNDPVAVCRNPADEQVGCGHDALYEHYQLYLYNNEWMQFCESRVLVHQLSLPANIRCSQATSATSSPSEPRTPRLRSRKT